MSDKSKLISIIVVAVTFITLMYFFDSHKGMFFWERSMTKDSVKHVNVGDIKVGYREYGSGYPLIMIIGFASSMNLWEQSFIDQLAKHFRVIIFDNRGMNQTSSGTKDVTIKQFAKDTAGFLSALGIEKANLLGWSMGSMVAQETFFLNSKVVNKLVLISSECNTKMFPTSQEVVNKLMDHSGTQEERGQRSISLLFPEKWINSNSDRIKSIFYRRNLSATDKAIIFKQQKAIEQWPGTCDKLSQINCPVLLITGDKDVIVSPQNSKYMAKNIKNSKLLEVGGAGHGVVFQDRDKVEKSIINFLNN
ncbi:alpha/beta hydrolase [bacterium]|nr:alpha/beta hydrolase [bacterium]